MHNYTCHHATLVYMTTLLGILGRALDATEDAGCVPAQRHAPTCSLAIVWHRLRLHPPTVSTLNQTTLRDRLGLLVISLNDEEMP
jgi:hypothetical protein